LPPTRQSSVSFFNISLIWFGLSFLWGGVLPVLLPLKVLSALPETGRGTYLAVVTIVGALIAVLWQPVAGWAGDHLRSGWGRRRPFVLAGTAVAAPAILVLSVATSPLGIAVAFLIVQLGANTVQAAAQAFIPDLVPEKERGRAASRLGAAQILGGILGPALAGAFAGQERALLAAGIIAGVFLISGGYTALTVPDSEAARGVDPEPAGAADPKADNPAIGPGSPRRRFPDLLRLAADAYRVELGKHTSFFRLVASRFLILLGIASVTPFAQLYVKEMIGAPDPAQSAGLLTSAMAAGALLGMYPSGRLADRFGRKPLIYAGGVIAASALFLFNFVGGLRSLLIFGAIAGLGYGMFVPAGWAMLVDLTPGDEPGRFLGLANIAGAGALILGPALAGPVLKPLNSLRPALGYDFLFTLIPAFILAGLAVLRTVKIGSARQPDPQADHESE